MNFKKMTSALLVAGMCSAAFAADGEFNLKGNVQTQATKMIADHDNNLSSFWIRANIGGLYKSENFDAQVMLRIFAPQFGNKIKDGDGKTTSYDKILADLYWANYKWNFDTYKLNLKIGHWKTDWSQSTHFGTYIDKDLTARGLWMRDYSHNAAELGWQTGYSNFTAMVATRDNKFNTGYIRLEEDLKFDFPFEAKFAYRVNAIDPFQNTAALTHRLATYLSYKPLDFLRVYGEYGYIVTQEDAVKTTAPNYVAPEYKYMKPGDAYHPFYIGAEYTPKKDCFMNTLMSSLYVEWEHINDRDVLSNNKDVDNWAWTVAWAKKIANSKLQFSVYSGNEISDVGFAFRLTSTIK
ncbi:MAG: hypothetical protein SPL52_00755 [Fibrobacter sp.]|nr:hypothetical protein [Fibrobacter sp.]